MQPVNEVVFGRVYRLNCDCLQVLFGDTEAEFYLEKTNCKLEGHPFSFFLRFKPAKYDWLFKTFISLFKPVPGETCKEMVCVEYSSLFLRRVAEDITL